MQEQSTEPKNSRRNFIKLSSFAAFAFHPTIKALVKFLNVNSDDIESCFDDEYHYFDDNLTNLHFYFINADINGRILKPKNNNSAFMVVKIPQQHIAEELLTEDNFKKYYRDTNKNTNSKISGFSFLAFELLPNRQNTPQQEATIFGNPQPTFIRFDKIEKLLDWNNESYFKLIIPEKRDYVTFNKSYSDFASDRDLQIEEKEAQRSIDFYKDACIKLFLGKQNNNYPVTLLEIPQGLLLTPYKGIKEEFKTIKAVFTNSKIGKQYFVYNTLTDKVHRSVEEIWNTQMWFQQFDSANKPIGEKYNPSLRTAGYVKESKSETRTKDECPKEDFTLLPSFLDKQEITYLTNLGNQKFNNDSTDWDIKTKGLIFTGLGAITKLHYKNFTPPNGTDLVEYEHHISLGRDEYIKVARIGVLSVSGQKAIHIKIGQRKIVSGISYMEYKQYIEIVQKEITYYSTKYFAENETRRATENFEPENYINLRSESLEKPDSILYEGSFWDNLKKQKPGSSRSFDVTHFRRLPYKSVKSVTLISPPIVTDPNSKIDCSIDGDCEMAFWPVLESDIKKDCLFQFNGNDWNDNSISFTVPFMFIRKKIIDNQNEPCIKAIYTNFQNSVNQRKQIRLNNQSISYTPDFFPKESSAEILPNKSNKSKTEFIEYDFGICKEDALPNNGSLFNLKYFPLFPQVRWSKLLVDNVQGYSPENIYSLIEYNDDFVFYAFHRTKEISASEIIKNYNKGKLIFNHPEVFIQGDAAAQDELKKIDETLIGGYNKINSIFGGAGDKIGGLVNPDIDIQSIGLVKQSIAVGKNINEKYKAVATAIDKIENFNPTDLLRKAPELFNGISLIDILQEVLPHDNAPWNDVRNITGQIADIENNPILHEINTEIETAKRLVQQLEADVGDIRGKIDLAEANLKNLIEKLNKNFQFPDIQNLVNSRIEQYKLVFAKTYDETLSKIEIESDKAIQFFVSDIISKVEIINQTYSDIEAEISNRIKRISEIDKDGKILKVINDALSKITPIFKNYNEIIFTDIKAKSLKSLTEISDRITPTINDYVTKYNALKAQLIIVNDEKRKLVDNISNAYESQLNKYLKLKTEFESKIQPYKDNRENAKKLLTLIYQTSGVSKTQIEAVEADILLIQSKLLNTYELVLTAELPYLIEKYETAFKDYKPFKSKIGLLISETSLNNIESLFPTIQNEIGKNRKILSDYYNSNYDRLRTEYDRLVLEGNAKVKDFTDSIVKSGVEEILPLITEIKDIQEQIKNEKDKLEKVVNNGVIGLRKDLSNKIKEYETKITEGITNEAIGIIGKVKKYITDLENNLLSDPNNINFINQVIAAQNLYNILTSVSQKEITYTWQTSSFKDADFGIISFQKLNNPNTTLTVNVKTIIRFQPNKFPSVIQDVNSIAENRLTNFGIGFMKAILINFHEVSFITGTNREPKFEVKIGDVQFAGAFSFVQAFESFLKSLMGDAFRLKFQPTNVNIGYTIPIPSINTPTFNFFNLTLNFDFWLYFNKKPMQFGFSLARPDNKFGISVGIYAGFGCFAIIAEPKRGITEIEVALEFGGYFGLSLGPISGEVKLVVGLYYKKDDSGVIIEGYFVCEGRAKLWFVMISVRFYMGVRSQGNYVEGRCTVTYEIRLGRFFKKSFEASYYKKIAGSTPGNNQGGMRRALNTYYKANQDEWTSISAMNLREDVIRVESNIYDTKLLNKSERTEKLMTKKQWKEFINSYND